MYVRGFFRSLTVVQGIPHGGRTRVYHLGVLQSPSETLSRMAETANRRGTSSEQSRPELTHQLHASERTRRALHTKHSAVAGLLPVHAVQALAAVSACSPKTGTPFRYARLEASCQLLLGSTK